MNGFDPLGALRLLTDAGVRFVLIGGIAARLRGSPTVTGDLDICHSLDADNLVKLSAALNEVAARLRGAEEVSVEIEPALLANTANMTFVTRFGALDCIGAPAGGRGYDELVRTAEDMDLGGFRLKVCSLEDLMHMKRSAGRPKDLIELEILGALQEEIDRHEHARAANFGSLAAPEGT